MKGSWKLAAGKIFNKLHKIFRNSYFSEKFFSKRDLVVEEMEETTAKLDKVLTNSSVRA